MSVRGRWSDGEGGGKQSVKSQTGGCRSSASSGTPLPNPPARGQDSANTDKKTGAVLTSQGSRHRLSRDSVRLCLLYSLNAPDIRKDDESDNLRVQCRATRAQFRSIKGAAFFPVKKCII